MPYGSSFLPSITTPCLLHVLPARRARMPHMPLLLCPPPRPRPRHAAPVPCRAIAAPYLSKDLPAGTIVAPTMLGECMLHAAAHRILARPLPPSLPLLDPLQQQSVA